MNLSYVDLFSISIQKSFMRKIILLAGLMFLGLSEMSKAQSLEKKWPSKLAIGHGIGNVWVSFLKDAINADVRAQANYTITGIGPLNLIYEHRLYKKISIGVNFSYSKVMGDGAYNGFVFSDQLVIISFLGRANYHLIQTRKSDLYFGIGGGYVHSQYQNNLNTPSSNVPGEFGYSAQIGASYDIIPHLAIYSEIGYVGGSFLQVGLCSRF